MFGKSSLDDDDSLGSGSFTSSWYDGNEVSSSTSHNNSTGGGSSPRKDTCGQRFLSELNPCQDWFLVADSVTGRRIDIPESFAAEDWASVTWKLIAMGTTLATLLFRWIESDSPEYFILRWNNWGLFWSFVYLMFSLINSTILARRIEQPPERVTGITKVTWIFFTFASHATIVSTIVYWAFDYNFSTTTLGWYVITSHSVVPFLVLVDGLFVNRIPMRLMHWFLIFIYDLAYIGWTVADSLAHVTTFPEEQDEAVYEWLDWSSDWERALIVSVVFLFGASPLIFLTQWLVATYWIPCGCCMEDAKRLRYVDRINRHEIEEHSIFGHWGL